MDEETLKHIYDKHKVNYRSNGVGAVSYTHLHNVPEKDIYRPAAWNAFGMDKEGADFRACKNYGPLYK